MQFLKSYKLSFEKHPDPNLVNIYIPSNINKVLSSDGSNYYFRENNKGKWMLTKGWSLAMNEVLYGNPTFAKYYIISRDEYIKNHCVYKKTPIGEIPIYITYKSRL
jgi:hypothetical protein